MDESKAAKPRGPKPEKPARPQIVEFLRLLGEGHGRAMCCQRTGLGYRRFLRHLRENRSFADAVRVAEQGRVEACEQLLFRLVTTPCDTQIKVRAAIAYLGRRDKLDEARRARRDKAARVSASK